VAGRSDEAVARALGEVLRDHGWDVAASARRLRGSLNDVLGAEADEHRAAVDAVVLAVEEGIVPDLLEAGRENLDDVLPALTSRLSEWGLAPAPAAWAVRTWATHLPAATIKPPVTLPPSPGPTALPPAAAPEPTALPPAAPSPEVGVTMAPPGPAKDATVLPPLETPDPVRPTRPARRRPSGRGLAVAGAVLVLMAGGVATAVALTGDKEDRQPDRGGAGSGTAAPDETEDAEPAPAPAPADPGLVLAASGVEAPGVEKPLAMAGRTGGVRVARLGDVDTVVTDDGERSAPEGGRLVAFRLAKWACGSGSCRPWDELGLKVSVDGARQPLPAAGRSDTFVVTVPADARDVDLVMRADGLTQTLSLLDARPGRGNIAVLARSGRVDRVGARFTMTERTTIAFDYDGVDRTSVPRDVTVTRAELTWFDGGARPSSPRKAFLKVRSHYTIPLGSYAGKEFAFYPWEMVFVAADGTRYEARDLDDGAGVDAVFEVPAGLKGGRLVLGGDSYSAVSGTTPFTRTLTRKSVPLRFG
jgi:hypothetical protein